MSLDSYTVLERKTGIQLSPGDKLCTNCFNAYNQSAATAAPREEDYYSPHDETYETEAAESRTINRHELNSILETLDCSPMKMVVNDLVTHGKRKLDKVVEKLTAKMQAVHNTDVKSPSQSDLNYLAQAIKRKMSDDDTSEKVRLLTLAQQLVI